MFVINQDCRAGMAERIADNSIDAIVTDPPYGLSKEPKAEEVLRHWLNGDDYVHTGGGFMGKSWDSFVPGPNVWREAFRVLKPGGYALVFAGSRTQDLMSMALRLAGFEIRDVAMWLYGSGFPKSLDVSKAIDARGGNSHLTKEIGRALKAARRPRGVTVAGADKKYCGGTTLYSWFEGRPAGQRLPTAETLAAIARDWPELGPYVEKIRAAEREVVGQKKSGIANPAEEARHTIGAGSTVVVDVTAPHTDAAQQWEGWGTALKPAYEPIIIARKPLIGTVADNVLTHGTGGINVDGCRIPSDEQHRQKCASVVGLDSRRNNNTYSAHEAPRTDSYSPLGRWPANVLHDGALDDEPFARYFYCAKASKADRNAGCEHLTAATAGEATGGRAEGSDGLNSPRSGAGRTGGNKNHHPTVKPTDLMRYCCRLVTPPGGLVLDPFAGSGSTGRGAMLEGFNFIGFEMDPEYAAIADARILDALTARTLSDNVPQRGKNQ